LTGRTGPPPLPAAVATPFDGPGGIGGTLRTRPSDFLVEEIPLIAPLGRGQHTIAQVEKRGISTFEVLLWISKAAKVSEHRIGYAGLKDARAVTRQYVSIPRVPPETVLALRHPRFRVLSAARHPVGLRVGHLRGNRFTIRVRDADLARLPAAQALLERIAARGLPNAYGTQRFGVRQDGHRIGRAVVHEDWATFVDHLLGRPSDLEMDPRVRAAREAYESGDLEGSLQRFPMRHRTEKKALTALLRTRSPREAFLALGRRPRNIWIAAWQSYLFNRVLDRRVREGTHDRLVSGDLAWLHGTGALYPVRDADREAPRASALASSPTGPLIGYDMRRPHGRALALEREVLDEEGADPEALRSGPARARGARRPLRVPVREASLSAEEDGSVVARFVLPPGAFATVLLDLLMSGTRAVPTGE
jgi:tRNA pseudouridine13 synthase